MSVCDPIVDSSCRIATEVLHAVHDLEPLLRQHARAAERERRLPDVVGRALREAGLYSLGAPKALGGSELDPISTFRVVEELSRIDSSVGWNVEIPVGLHAFGAWLGSDGVEEIFTKNVVFSGALNPPARIVEDAGGYRITGRTPFVSGCHQCDWYLVPAVLMDGDTPRQHEGSPVTLVTFVPASGGEIIENWDTLGMRGTGSHDVAMTDQFIKASWTAPMAPLERPNPYFTGPLYKLKFWPSIALVAAPALGAARAAIADFITLAQTKTPAYTRVPLRERPIAQAQVACAEAELGAARAYVYEALAEAWASAQHGKWISLDQKMKIQLAACQGIVAAVRAVDLVWATAGATAIRDEAPFQKYFRDVHTITQHAFVSASRFETVGRYMLDVDLDWPFFAL